MKTMDKPYDLEDRTHEFARDTRGFTKQLKRTIENVEDIKQVVRSSGSVAANYIEANEALSPKDFLHRIKICRKEAKESRLWLRLLDTHEVDNREKQRVDLMQESTELMNIFGSIIRKREK
jgi:four helix bundle protein